MSDFVALDVMVEDEGWKAFIGDGADMCRQAAKLALPVKTPTEVSFVFTTDDAIAQLNAEYRGKEGSTNVLSFPLVQIAVGDPIPPMLGDVVMALGVVTSEAADAGIEVRDHILHLLIHGLLHLIGHDHETDEEAELMENEERRLLASVGIADPYAVSPTA
ncbi:MAG: rRNA maturation RNase YbeY [Pseudomonadota bacterium]